MAEPDDVRKQTVRIAPPAPGASGASGENPRIKLPARPPTSAPPPSVPQRTDERRLPPAPPAPGPQEPKKETANVAETARRTAVEMKKTQPLITMPEPAPGPAAPLTFTPEPELPTQNIPAGLCWLVLGISTVILIIQIWNYFS